MGLEQKQSSNVEFVHDERCDYLVRVLSRTKRKDYENYVVNAVWQQHADPELKPETQRYVRRKYGYALIDLYFPAVNVGIECDEGYHLNSFQKERDKAREREIVSRLSFVTDDASYIACHVHAYSSFEQIEREIKEAVSIIKKRKEDLAPVPWNPNTPPWEAAKKKGSIHVGDDVSFRTIADVCKCFGRNPKAMQKCYFSLHYDWHYLWCPQLAIEMPDGTVVSAAGGWTNVLAYDGNVVYQASSSAKAGSADHIRRVTFAKGRDELDRVAYRFIGVFRNDGPKPDDPMTSVLVRESDSIDLSFWN